jgi:hypothetical protein
MRRCCASQVGEGPAGSKDGLPDFRFLLRGENAIISPPSAVGPEVFVLRLYFRFRGNSYGTLL